MPLFYLRSASVLLSCLLFISFAYAYGTGNDDFFDMSLSELMDQEITTAGKTPEKVSDIPASVIVITAEEISRYGYGSVREILEAIPGIYTIDNYASNDVSLGIRGFWAPFTRGVVIMVDGADMKQDKYCHYPLNKIDVPVEAINRIEVIRGPMSVMYGSGAFFGAINIITSEKDSPSHFSISSGAEDSYRVACVTGASSGDMSVGIKAMVSTTDGMDRDFGDMSSDPYYTGVSTKSFFEQSSYWFQLSGTTGNFYSHIMLVRSDKPWYFVEFNKYQPNKKLSDYGTYRIGYKKDLSKDINLHSRFGYYFTNVQSTLVWKTDPATGELITPETRPDMLYSAWSLNSASYDLETNLHYTYSENIRFTLGVYYKRLIQCSERDNLPSLPLISIIDQPHNSHLQTYAIFTQANFSLTNNLKVVAGLRFEKNGEGRNIFPMFFGDTTRFSMNDIPLAETKWQAIPRLAVLYDFDGNNMLKLLYGKAMRMPAYLENNDIALYPGNKPIEPEEIETLEANFISTPLNNLGFHFSIYHNMLNNLVYRREWVENGVYHATTTNEGEIVTTGAEMSVRAGFDWGLNMEVSAAYQKTEDKNNPDRTVTASPEALAYFRLAYSFTDKISLALTGNYAGEMVAQWNTAAYNPDTDTYGMRFGKDTPGYLNLGAYIKYNDIVDIGGLNLLCRASNLLGTDIRYPAYTMSRWANKGTLGRGRYWEIKLDYVF